MREKVKVDAKRQLMRIKFGARSTVDSWKVALAEVRRLSVETGIRRVLVDVRAQPETSDTGSLFDFAANLPHSTAFAVLCDVNSEDHQFIQTVAQNRGILVQDFDSERGAIEWLMNVSSDNRKDQ
jgi:hypothetical protein